jgi:hypothetical protein
MLPSQLRVLAAKIALLSLKLPSLKYKTVSAVAQEPLLCCTDDHTLRWSFRGDSTFESWREYWIQ